MRPENTEPFKRKRPAWTFLAVATLLAGMPAVHATEPGAATEPAPSTPDKDQYNLLNPTPPALLRAMDTDRPNVTNTPHTVDAGHLQIETGLLDYFLFRHRVPAGTLREEGLLFGQANFRLGVLNNLEINAVVDPYETDHTPDPVTGHTDHESGFGDTVVGGKFNFWGNEGSDETWATALAIQPQLKIPTARGGLGNDRFEWTCVAPFLVNLPAEFHLSVQPGMSMERNTTNTGYVPGFLGAIAVDRVVLAKLDLYLEYAADVTSERHTRPRQTVNVGGTYPLTANVMLDGGMNFGLDRVSPNVELLMGISVRF